MFANFIKLPALKTIIMLLVVIVFQSCLEKPKVDTIIINARKIYTLDEESPTFDCIVIDSGKIKEIGKTRDILNKYDGIEIFNALGKSVYPGFIDAHCHFYGFGTNYFRVDLTETKSWHAVLDSINDFSKRIPDGWLVGRGWDQNKYEGKVMPLNDSLNYYFPDRPVFLIRIDGHAAIANNKALELAGINASTVIEGGLIEKKNGKLTGVLIDNAVDLVKKVIPPLNRAQQVQALKFAQRFCLKYGLTTVSDAGLDLSIVKLIDSLQQTGDLSIKVYAMLNPNQENLEFAKQKGIYKTSRLTVRSFKLYADGALGSRGALMKKHYSDMPGHFGLWLTPNDSLNKYMQFALSNNYQVNTHCIGDSANANILNIYGSYLKDLNDLRWRIEHAQIIDEVDFDLFRKYTVIPSVQPTHATSDRLWAGSRIGEERMKNAYAYLKLYNQNKIIAFGSDFPVEGVNPLLGFYSAVVRKPAGSPEAYPFQSENAMSRQDALRAMTYWAAMANFEENEKGTITVGKNADLVILDIDLMSCGEEEIYKAKVVTTIINGVRVFNYQNRL